MGLFERWRTRFDRPGPGVTGPAPDAGFAQFRFLLGTFFPRLMLLNLLFLLCCLPVVTIPAAYAGMYRVLMLLARGGATIRYDAYWQEFRAAFLPRLLVGLPLFALPALCWALAPQGGMAGLWLSLLLSLLSCLLQCYYFPIVALIDLPPALCLKNAAILLMMDWKRALLLLIPFTAQLLLTFFLPLTLPFTLLVQFSLPALFTVCVVRGPIERHLAAQ